MSCLDRIMELTDVIEERVLAADWAGEIGLDVAQLGAESLAALGSGRVIVVPGAKYRAIVAAANSPLGDPIRQAARAVRARWRK